MKLSSLWKILFAFLPATGMCDAFDDARAAYAGERDTYRRAQIVERANAPSIVIGATTQTVVMARDARLADREAKYLAELAGAGLSVTTDFDAAADTLNANGNNNATLRLGLRLFTLRARIFELGGDPKAATGRTAETNTVILETRTSPAMQRLGRPATAEDLKGGP